MGREKDSANIGGKALLLRIGRGDWHLLADLRRYRRRAIAVHEVRKRAGRPGN